MSALLFIVGLTTGTADYNGQTDTWAVQGQVVGYAEQEDAPITLVDGTRLVWERSACEVER